MLQDYMAWPKVDWQTEKKNLAIYRVLRSG